MWFGGQWIGDKHLNTKATVKVAGYNEDIKISKYWALRLEHNDNEVNGRRWYVDFGLQTSEDEKSIRLRTKVSYCMLPGFLGSFEAPLSSIPNIIKNILKQSDKWTARCGSIIITPGYRTIKVGAGRDFVNNILKNRERKIPILLISTDYRTSQPLVNPAMFSSALFGTVKVYITQDRDTDEEIRIYLGDDYRCMNGTIRLYVPMDVDSLGDSKIHRYYLPFDIAEKGENTIIQELINGLSRFGKSWLERSVEDIDNVDREKYKYLLTVFKKDAERYAEKFGKKEEEFDQFITYFDREEEILNNKIERLEEELDNTKKEYDAEKHKNSQLKRSLDAKQSATEITGVNDIRDLMTTLPRTIEECLVLITKLFPKRIVIDDEEKALNSARKTAFDDIHSCWDALFSIATILYDAKFEGGTSTTDLMTIYSTNKPYELTFTEGKLTKKNAKLMKERQVLYEGVSYDITPHVKINKKTCLRIHFAFIESNNLILIGHCGDHLPTAGTQKRKE